MNDGRKSARRTVVHGAWIFAGAEAPSIPCVLQDVSETGARLKIDPAAEVPTDFILVLSRDGRLNRRCRMVWRDKGILGIRFVTTQSIAPKQEPPSELNVEAKKQLAKSGSKSPSGNSPARAPTS